MSMEYIRKTYGVPAKRGGHVKVSIGKDRDIPVDGVIVGSKGARLRIRIAGQKHILSYHPTWRIEY